MMLANVKIEQDKENCNSPCKLSEACKILLEELQKHGELYDGFKASIISAINDTPNYTPTEKVAERILNRMIGEG